MENFINFDQASCEKSCTLLCQHLNEMYWEKRASDSCTLSPKSSNILSTQVEGSRIDSSPCDLYFSNSCFDSPPVKQVPSKIPPFNKGVTNVFVLSQESHP